MRVGLGVGSGETAHAATTIGVTTIGVALRLGVGKGAIGVGLLCKSGYCGRLAVTINSEPPNAIAHPIPTIITMMSFKMVLGIVLLNRNA